MKNPISRITLFAFLFLLASFAPPGKVKYSPSVGKLSIIFPAAYETEDMSTDTYASVQAKATLDDILFFVTYNIHKTQLSDHESLAQTSLTSFVEAMQGEIIKQNTWKVKKNNGLRASFNMEELGLKGDYGVVLVGQIQYQVAVVSAKDQWNQKLSDAFFKSFKLTK